MRRLAVLTSGGDAPGMNAAIRAVVRYSIYNQIEVFGVIRGYKGLMNGDLIPMNVSSVGDIIHRGGTILKSARALEFLEESGKDKALEVLSENQIDGLIVIGGDGSFRGAREMSLRGMPSIGIPGTIDNDLSYTDYTIGFDTAVNTALDAIGKLRDTSSSHERVSIVEVMGRNCGDIALYAGMGGGAEAILVPEIPYDIKEISNKLLESSERGKTQSIIVVAEGAASAEQIARQISELTGMESRTTILGHIQRGGSPTGYDRVLASKLGAAAVECLLQGKKNRVVGIKNNKIIDLDIIEALDIPRRFDTKMHDLSKVLSI
ncbi:MAG: 6-phosphofructokinase [Peptostreptococcaceae bacterium]|nr:6-phosphofructokinase [Peptostreptococcaceae bacterium]